MKRGSAKAALCRGGGGIKTEEISGSDCSAA